MSNYPFIKAHCTNCHCMAPHTDTPRGLRCEVCFTTNVYAVVVGTYDIEEYNKFWLEYNVKKFPLLFTLLWALPVIAIVIILLLLFYK